MVPAPSRGDQTLVRLSCLDDDAQGQALEILWEKEVDAELLGETSWAKVAEKGFDPPTLFASYLHTLRWDELNALPEAERLGWFLKKAERAYRLTAEIRKLGVNAPLQHFRTWLEVFPEVAKRASQSTRTR